jgi:phage tail-like protein
MTASCQNMLIIADSGNRRVQIFQTDGMALRKIIGPLRVHQAEEPLRVSHVNALPVDVSENQTIPQFAPDTWHPYDVAVTMSGILYVSDRANSLIHVIDPSGRWLTAWDGRDDEGVTLTCPTHLALDCDENLYIVQDESPDVVVLNPQGDLVGRLTHPKDLEGSFAVGGIGIDSNGNVHLTDPGSGGVMVFDVNHTESSSYHPIDHQCSPASILFTGDGYAALIDKLAGIVYKLVESSSYTTQEYVILGPLDSQQYRCVWHRVVIEGKVAQGTLLQVDTFTADTPKLPAQITDLPEHRWETRQMHGDVTTDEWDCLIRSQPGQFLWIRLSLYGDTLGTPTIDAIRVEYPRDSSLRHLPGIYQGDAHSAEFLDRYLSIIDLFWRQIGTTLSDVPRLLDPAGTPAEFLPWLASWFGLVLKQNWSEDVQRRLIKQAHELYRLRGTPAGLKLHIELITGHTPTILEHYKLRRWLFLNRGRLGSQAVLWGSDVQDRLKLDEHNQVGEFQLIDHGDPLLDPLSTYSHRFAVYITLPHADENDHQIIEEIVELAKPAHTLAEVKFVQPGLCLGRELFLGINMIVADYPSGVTINDSSLGQGLVLGQPNGPHTPNMQMGNNVRMGVNARLDS